MSGASGLFHRLVWTSDVRIEVDATAEIARDFGLLAVAEDDDFRAVMLTVGNTRFTLKKGAAARPQPGHLLWFVGQGAWSDADADALGYVKIAEEPRNALQNMDRLTIELVRRGEECEAGFGAGRDAVSLRGTVRGDDGRGMEAARVGIFTNPE
jgi:hypothetical protein